MDWSTLFERLGMFGIGVAGLAWFMKTLVMHGLTRKVEEKKTELEKEVEAHKAELARQNFAHEKQYESERMTFERIWAKALALSDAVANQVSETRDELEDAASPKRDASTQELLRTLRAKRAEAEKSFADEYRQARPFYPKEIYISAKKLWDLAIRVDPAGPLFDKFTGNEFFPEEIDPKEFRGGLDEFCEAIRTRLSRFQPNEPLEERHSGLLPQLAVTSAGQNVTLNMKRGLHRIFLLACAGWALFVLGIFPIRQASRAREFASQSLAFDVARPSEDPAGKLERERKSAELYSQATVQYIYRHEMLPHWGLVLGTLFLPPLAVYALARSGIAVVGWVVQGFRK